MSLITEIKKTAKIILRGCGVKYDRLSAKTISFEDLARGGLRVIVKVHGLHHEGGAWNLARAVARDHGFTIQE